MPDFMEHLDKLCRIDIERSGEIHEGSDIDLLIAGDFSERFFEKIGKILDLHVSIQISKAIIMPENRLGLNR